MDLLELLKTIGAAAGNIVTISGCLALCIRPIREKLARFIRRASRTDASEKRIADMFAMLEQHIEADQAKIVSSELLKKPFLRGFPTLIETLVNGIKALNLSAERSTEGTGEELKDWQLVLTLIVSLLFAVGLFVVVPHLLSIIMNWIGLGGDVEGFSFHIWDGLFKFLIFIGYIVGIAFLPDIRRVFCYHGAEHKTIHAYESGDTVTPESAIRFSRLHPRCGTTFLLFVMSIAILLHTVLVPLLLLVWTPDSAVAKHLFTIAFKLLLMVPISALSYELIRYAARLGDGFWGRILRAPGMFLQLLTTREPELDQVEVAVAALASAVGQHPPRLETPPTCNRSH
jgi:uncharacterized protein YqhQ